MLIAIDKFENKNLSGFKTRFLLKHSVHLMLLNFKVKANVFFIFLEDK